MTWAEYRRKTEQQLRDRRIVLLEPIQSRYIKLPAGTIGTIQRKWKGLEITFDPCPCCGAQAVISQISPTKISLTLLEA